MNGRAQSKRYTQSTSGTARPGLKAAIKTLLEELPWLGDLFIDRYQYPRRATLCRGVFATHAQALASIPPGIADHYDICNEIKDPEKAFQRVDLGLDYEDYPLLFWLASNAGAVSSVLDVGGSLGNAYYGVQQALPLSARWFVLELPGAVALGQSIADRRGEAALEFVTTVEQVPAVDLLFTMGTLQYMPERIDALVKQLPQLPRLIMINKVPVYDGEPYWTVQNLEVARVPYYIHNRQQLIQSLEALGYACRDSFDTARCIRMPHYPEQDVSSYSGFLFELAAAAD